MKIIGNSIDMLALALMMTAFTATTAFADRNNYQSVGEAIAETGGYAQYAFQVEEGSIQKVFSDQTNVRSLPNLKAMTIDQLNIAQEVEILQQANVLELGNRSAHWYKIRYKKEGITHTGYIWGANLSIGYRQLNDYIFLLGANASPSRKNNRDNYSVNLAIKVVKDNQLKQTVEFDANSGSMSSVHFNWGGQAGLKGIDKLLVAGVSGEACGIPSENKYMLWDGDRLIELPTATSVSDAGVFYYIEQYIFPSDEEGIEGHVVMKIEEGNSDVELVDGKNAIFEETVKRKIYKWKVDSNGKNGRLIALD